MSEGFEDRRVDAWDFVQPLLTGLRAQMAAKGQTVGAYAWALNRHNGERYLYGIDPLGREFAWRFTPEELESFIYGAQAIAGASLADT